MTRSDKPFDDSLFQAYGGPELIAALQHNARQIRLLQAQQLDLILDFCTFGVSPARR
jgi:hypothetical protein